MLAEGGEAFEALNNAYHRFLLKGHESGVLDLDVHGCVAISGSYDWSVRVWDVQKGEQCD